MNPATLRRLATEHRSLHTSPLPPNYLFPPSSASLNIPDDLTQLTVLLSGPEGTPYALGLWRVHLKMPEDYPRSPPKASFRTKIWHPNVDEGTGAVCVDMLKRDWKADLTVRDVLITISCLLIHPNPDSALNSAAGHLLQDDYDAFARQAKLMTSIHAPVPKNLVEAVAEAKNRGEGPETQNPKDAKGQRRRPQAKAPSSLVDRSRSQVVLPQRPATQQHHPQAPSRTSHDSDEEDVASDDEAAASKENDPSLSPSPVSPPPPPSPRKKVLGKRPLSDLPTPTEDEFGSEEDMQYYYAEKAPTGSAQNIAANPPAATADEPFRANQNGSSSGPRKSPKLSERGKGVNASGRIRGDVDGVSTAGTVALASTDRPEKTTLHASDVADATTTKTALSSSFSAAAAVAAEGKENLNDDAEESKGDVVRGLLEKVTAVSATALMAKPAMATGSTGLVAAAAASAATTVAKLVPGPTPGTTHARAAIKPRVGLRRL